MKHLTSNLTLMTLLQFFILGAGASEEVNLMSAKYCSDFSENLVLKYGEDEQSTVTNRINFCSKSQFLPEHIESGEAKYIGQYVREHDFDVLGVKSISGSSNLTAIRGDYYCQLIAGEAKTTGTGLGQTGETILECGKRESAHAKVIENVAKARQSAQSNLSTQSNGAEQSSVAGSIYSANTPKATLELAVKQAKVDLANAQKLAAYFYNQSGCSTRGVLSSFNGYYDPLKNSVYTRFRAPGESAYVCLGSTRTSFETKEDSLSISVETQAYAASTVIPLIQGHIDNYERYLQGSAVTGTLPEGISVYSGNGVNIDIDTRKISKVFFFKQSLCVVESASEKGYYDLKCMKSLDKGFKFVSNFEGIPQVSHFGVCSLNKVKSNYYSQTYKVEDEKFVANPLDVTKANTPENHNDLASLNCVTDVEAKNKSTKSVKIKLDEEIEKLVSGLTYSKENDSETALAASLTSKIMLSWSKGNYQAFSEDIKVTKDEYSPNLLTFSLRGVTPLLEVSDTSSCLIYAVNLSAAYNLKMRIAGTRQNSGNSSSRASKSYEFSAPVNDLIYTFKKCSDSPEEEYELALDRKIPTTTGLTYSTTVPSMNALLADRSKVQTKTMEGIMMDFSRSGSMKVIAYERISDNGGNAKVFLNQNARSGVGYTTRTDRYTYYQSIGNISYLILNDIGKELTGKELNRNRTMTTNYCSSTTVANGACCFGLVEGADSCEMKPLGFVSATVAGTDAGSDEDRPISSDLNMIQNLSLECLKAENKESEECKSNPNMVALGFISYMMEQFFRMQTELMFQNFAASMQIPGADIQAASQASNAVSLLNSQNQANSMLGMYYGSVVDTPVPVVQVPVVSPPLVGIPFTSMFGNSFAATNYSVPFPTQQEPGIMNAWLQGGGTYGIARDVSSEITYLNNSANRLATNASLLSISDPNRKVTGIAAYPAKDLEGVSVPESFNTDSVGISETQIVASDCTTTPAGNKICGTTGVVTESVTGQCSETCEKPSYQPYGNDRCASGYAKNSSNQCIKLTCTVNYKPSGNDRCASNFAVNSQGQCMKLQCISTYQPRGNDRCSSNFAKNSEGQCIKL